MPPGCVTHQTTTMKAYKYYKRMQGIGAVRIVLGLTQEAMAMELGVSRSLLSKAENKTRSLPTAAMIKLAALHARMVELQKTKENDTIPGAAATAAATSELSNMPVFALIKKMELQAAQLQHDLNVMIHMHGHLVQCLANVEGLLYAPQNQDAGKGLAYLKIHRAIIIRKITRCGPVMQAALRKKIALLRAAAALK